MAETRQLFAAAAMSGRVGCRDWGLLTDGNIASTRQKIVERSWQLADEMLAAEHPPAPPPEPAAVEPASPPAETVSDSTPRPATKL
jgi:hypothetical protein